jgi:hypothetical protein
VISRLFPVLVVANTRTRPACGAVFGVVNEAPYNASLGPNAAR